MKLVTAKATTPRSNGVVVWQDNELKVKKGKEVYPIPSRSLELSKNTKVVYSLPTNSRHPVGTKKEVDFVGKHINFDTIQLFWSKYKVGSKIRGIVVDNKFIPNDKQSSKV
jgi:hypothetical protein